MTQTTGAINAVNGKIEVSANGSSWTDISGSTNKVEEVPQEADTGEAATLEGDYMIPTAGKFKPVELAITVLYTEVANEAWSFFNTQRAVAGRPIYVRYSPAGGASGDKRFFTANGAGTATPGRITKFTFPRSDAGEASPVMLAMTVRCATLGVETI